MSGLTDACEAKQTSDYLQHGRACLGQFAGRFYYLVESVCLVIAQLQVLIKAFDALRKKTQGVRQVASDAKGRHRFSEFCPELRCPFCMNRWGQQQSN